MHSVTLKSIDTIVYHNLVVLKKIKTWTWTFIDNFPKGAFQRQLQRNKNIYKLLNYNCKLLNYRSSPLNLSKSTPLSLFLKLLTSMQNLIYYYFKTQLY